MTYLTFVNNVVATRTVPGWVAQCAQYREQVSEREDAGLASRARPPGIPGREFPGIPGNRPSQEFPREFPGITEFSAGIAGNFKNLVNFVFLFRILKACYHENSFSSSFEFKSSNYFILDHSNYWSFLSFLMMFATSVIHRRHWYVISYLTFYLARVFGMETRMIGFTGNRNQKILMMD